MEENRVFITQLAALIYHLRQAAHHHRIGQQATKTAPHTKATTYLRQPNSKGTKHDREEEMTREIKYFYPSFSQTAMAMEGERVELRTHKHMVGTDGGST